ncbi:MAG: ABC transporter permease subunit [Clostridia bacterium]|nr:ABC transporter permease subunit [Clostridia bacterium]
MKRRNVSRIVIQVCLALFFITVVIAPIIMMFTRITPDSLSELTGSADFVPSIINSITTALTATVISMLLAVGASFSLCRTNIRGKGVFGMLFVLPMLIPSISHAYGLKALIGVNGSGILSSLLGLDLSVLGFWGIVAGSVMYSFPVAFLMLQSILQYEDGMQYKAAAVLGIPAYRRFFSITLPYMRKTLISMFFAVFTMIMTDYGVPEALHTREFGYTLSILMLRSVENSSFGIAGIIGVMLLVPAVVAFAVDMLVPELSQSGFVSEAVDESKGKLQKILAYLFCIILSVAIIMPITAFVIQVFSKSYPTDLSFSLSHIKDTMRSGADGFLLNSLLYSLFAALFGTLLAFICAYMTTRAKSKVTKAVHLMSITSVAIPGLVLGLSYVIFFKNSFIYGTVFIIGLANAVHFFASPYLMMYNTLGKVNADLEDVGKTLGIRRIRIITDVIVPKVRFTLFEMAVYFFVNSMMTISAVSLLAPPSPQPLSLMIARAESQIDIGKAAAVSLMILLINFIVKLIITLINRKRALK